VHRRLDGDVIAQVGPAPVVHGDYRLDNVVLSPAGRVRVVLAWKLYTLGDPLAAVVTAEVCGCPVGTIRSRVARARVDLTGQLRDSGLAPALATAPISDQAR
jgi:aminoglycoside phosphotransferase (APT) family kinase protein